MREDGTLRAKGVTMTSPTLNPENWGLHEDPMFERNYCADNFLTVYFNVPPPGNIYRNIIAQFAPDFGSKFPIHIHRSRYRGLSTSSPRGRKR